MKIFLFKHKKEMLIVLAQSQKDAEDILVGEGQAVRANLEFYGDGRSFSIAESPWMPGFEASSTDIESPIPYQGPIDAPGTWSQTNEFWQRSKEKEKVVLENVSRAWESLVIKENS